jgi:hypothetical protein
MFNLLPFKECYESLAFSFQFIACSFMDGAYRRHVAVAG